MGKLGYVSEDRRFRTIFKRALKTFVRTVVGTLIIGMVGIGVFVAWKYLPTIEEWYEDSCEMAAKSTISDFKSAETSYVYDEDGNTLLKLRMDKDVEYVEYEQLPKSVVNAFVAIEDKRFYEHHGVDWLSTAKAAYLLVRDRGEITRGGSTITQQLARNIYLSFTQSYERKVREIFLALELEKKYSKEEILEFYVNNVNFANGYYGIGAAAKGYFGKGVSELSTGEMALLCAIPNNPTYYNPRKNLENTMKRRDTILSEMYSQGYLSSREYVTAVNDGITLAQGSEEVDDYAASYALNCVVKEFMWMQGFRFEYDWSNRATYKQYLEEYDAAYDEALRTIKVGGYSIQTTLSSERQRALQEDLDQALSGFTEVDEDGKAVIQGAATVVDNDTGKVIGIVGGRSDAKSTTLGLNRAFQSYKQPGSTIKPLVVYTPAFENGYTADTAVYDTPIEDGPSNSDGRYSGRISLRTAVEKSKNVVAWKIFEELTPNTGLQKLKKMSFSKIVPEDNGLASALGGLTYGVTTEEMAGGYCALANSGVWREPTCITSIKDANGNEIYQGQLEKSVYSAVAADTMTDALKGVGKSGTAAGLHLAEGNEFACKTGTTNNNKTAWFCGYTKQYTIAVYVGADESKESIRGLWGSTYPASVWKAMQDTLLSGKKALALLDEEQEQHIQENSSLPSVREKLSSKPVEQPMRPEQPEEQQLVEEPVEQPVEQPVEPAEQPVEPEQSVEPEQPVEQPVEQGQGE